MVAFTNFYKQKTMKFIIYSKQGPSKFKRSFLFSSSRAVAFSSRAVAFSSRAVAFSSRAKYRLLS
jgi:hypothetical protein